MPRETEVEIPLVPNWIQWFSSLYSTSFFDSLHRQAWQEARGVLTHPRADASQINSFAPINGMRNLDVIALCQIDFHCSAVLKLAGFCDLPLLLDHQNTDSPYCIFLGTSTSSKIQGLKIFTLGCGRMATMASGILRADLLTNGSSRPDDSPSTKDWIAN